MCHLQEYGMSFTPLNLQFRSVHTGPYLKFEPVCNSPSKRSREQTERGLSLWRRKSLPSSFQQRSPSRAVTLPIKSRFWFMCFTSLYWFNWIGYFDQLYNTAKRSQAGNTKYSAMNLCHFRWSRYHSSSLSTAAKTTMHWRPSFGIVLFLSQ